MYEGSIEIIYTVVFVFLNLVNGLMDLYDAIRLIWEISELYINKKLRNRFGKYFRGDTYVIVPEYKNDWWIKGEKWLYMEIIHGKGMYFSITCWLQILCC